MYYPLNASEHISRAANVGILYSEIAIISLPATRIFIVGWLQVMLYMLYVSEINWDLILAFSPKGASMADLCCYGLSFLYCLLYNLLARHVFAQNDTHNKRSKTSKSITNLKGNFMIIMDVLTKRFLSKMYWLIKKIKYHYNSANFPVYYADHFSAYLIHKFFKPWSFLKTKQLVVPQ